MLEQLANTLSRGPTLSSWVLMTPVPSFCSPSPDSDLLLNPMSTTSWLWDDRKTIPAIDNKQASK